MKVHGAVQGSLMSTLGMGEGENRTLANGQWGCCLLKAVVYVPSMTSKQSKTLNHLQYVSLRKEGDLFFFFGKYTESYTLSTITVIQVVIFNALFI